MATRIYNPLEKLNLARSIKSEILSSEAFPLRPTHAISGAGVYVIYYAGPFAPYAGLALANAQSWEQPITLARLFPKEVAKAEFRMKMQLWVRRCPGVCENMRIPLRR